MLSEHSIDWTLEWKKKEFEEGREEVRQEARIILLEQIEQRFGAVPDRVRQRVEAMNSMREIVQAVARVVAAPSLDALDLP